MYNRTHPAGVWTVVHHHVQQKSRLGAAFFLAENERDLKRPAPAQQGQKTCQRRIHIHPDTLGRDVFFWGKILYSNILSVVLLYH